MHFNVSFSISFEQKKKSGMKATSAEMAFDPDVLPSKCWLKACEYSVDAWVKFFSACLYCFYAKIRQLFWRLAVSTTSLLRRLLSKYYWEEIQYGGQILGCTLYNLFASWIYIENLKILLCVLIGKSNSGPKFGWSSQIWTKIWLADRNLVLTERRRWSKT